MTGDQVLRPLCHPSELSDAQLVRLRERRNRPSVRHTSDTLLMSTRVHGGPSAATDVQTAARESQKLRVKRAHHAIRSTAGALLTMEVLYQLS